MASNFFLPIFLLHEKPPQSNPELSQVVGTTRLSVLRKTRSSKSNNNEANTTQAPAFVTTQQLQDKAAKKRQAAKKAGGEILKLLFLM